MQVRLDEVDQDLLFTFSTQMLGLCQGMCLKIDRHGLEGEVLILQNLQIPN